jgi:hypothetical protein
MCINWNVISFNNIGKLLLLLTADYS